MRPAPPWWKTAVVYQIYPRSFADGTGDGVGDLTGLIDRLDHVRWLGADAVWLSPIFPSPMADFGYDVADHCDVDPLFGDLDLFDRFVAEAHRRGLRVLLDWVPNHTSDQHPWFVDARSGRDSAHRDFYLWRDPGEGGAPPNNWTGSFAAAPTWTVPPGDDQAYLHLFLPEQPDLNWDNPAVERAMHDVLRFWLARGVDGFRADVVHCIGKPAGLADDPAEVVGLPHVVLNDVPRTHELLRGIRAVLDEHPGDVMMVGEVVLLDPERVATYYGDGDELHLSFNFAPFHAPWDAEIWRGHVRTALEVFLDRGLWPTWVLSNHDNPRLRTRCRAGLAAGADADLRSERRARVGATMLCTLPGTPFLYAGEELGLDDAVIPEGSEVDPAGRDGCRAPLPWSRAHPHGWPTDSGTGPWLPFPPEAAARSVQAQREDPGSVLHLYRRLLAQRRSSEALRSGACELLDAPPGVLAYRRSREEAAVTVLANFTGAAVDCSGVLAGAGSPTVLVSSDGTGEGDAFAGTLAGDAAVVLTAS